MAHFSTLIPSGNTSDLLKAAANGSISFLVSNRAGAIASDGSFLTSEKIKAIEEEKARIAEENRIAAAAAAEEKLKSYGIEYSAGGDYRRIPRTISVLSMDGVTYADGLRPDAGPNYHRGAGAPHQYDYQKKGSDGSWNWVDPGEHYEGETYFWAGVNSPAYLNALAAEKAGEATALDKARLSAPEAVGQAITRSEQSLTGGSNEDDLRQELAFYGKAPAGTEALYTPEMQSAISSQITNSTPAAQSARAEADSGGFGDLLPLAALIAVGIATGGFGLAGEAAVAGGAESLAAADAMAGIGATEFGAAGAAAASGITGNAALDSYLTNGGALKSGLINAGGQLLTTGEIDPGKLLTGVVSGGLNAYGNTLVSDLGLDPSIAKGLTAAAVGTGMGVLQGQDLDKALTGGLINGVATGVGNAVGTTVRDNMIDSQLADAAAQNNTVIDGEQAFAENPVEPVQPVTVDTGSTGGFSDLVSDLVSPNTAGTIAGTIAGNVTGGLLTDAATGSQQQAPIVDVSAADPVAVGVSFRNVVPQNVIDADRTTDWTGTRLMDAGRI